MSLIRLYYLLYGFRSNDVTWRLGGLALWSAVELNVAIACACLMLIKPLLSAVLPKLFPPAMVRNSGGAHLNDFPDANLDRFRRGPTVTSEITTTIVSDPQVHNHNGDNLSMDCLEHRLDNGAWSSSGDVDAMKLPHERRVDGNVC